MANRIAIVGGTGDFGIGLAARLSTSHEVYIGSRDEAKARSAADVVKKLSRGSATGLTNDEATRRCDIAVLAIPSLPTADALTALAGNLKGKLVISPIVPMTYDGNVFSYTGTAESAAEKVAASLQSSVASAFHTVAADKLLKIDEELAYDVLVAADSRETFAAAAPIVSSISRLRPLYAGPLKNSRLIEAMTPLLLNVAKYSKIRSPSFKLA